MTGLRQSDRNPVGRLLAELVPTLFPFCPRPSVRLGPWTPPGSPDRA